MFKKFLKRCQKMRFMMTTTRAASIRDHAYDNNVAPTMAITKGDFTSAFENCLLPSLNDHFAATKIQLAYRRYKTFRNTKSSLCWTDASTTTMDFNKHCTLAENATSSPSSSEDSKSYEIEPVYQDDLARNAAILQSPSFEGLCKFHANKAVHLESPDYGELEVGSPNHRIPHSKDQKSDKTLELVNWKTHLEPKSRNRTPQRLLQHVYGLCISATQFSSRKSRVDVADMVPVYLNVYDLSAINSCLYWLGLGAHHSGIQVHDVEYAFGMDVFGSAEIFRTEPKEFEGFTVRKEILIGWTQLGAKEVKKVINEVADQYIRKGYHLITNNCNHFSTDACIRLTGNSIPHWVNRPARIGSLFVRSASLWRKKISDCRESDTTSESKFKTLSFSNRFMGSFSSPSSLSSVSSDSITVTGKSSHWQKTLKQSIPLDWIL